jgi:ATP-binding protein involved in chromosome partitioning
MSTPSLSIDSVQTCLSTLIDPNTGKDFVSSKSVKNLKITEGIVSANIELAYPAKTQLATIQQQIDNAIRTLPGCTGSNISIASKIIAHKVQGSVKLLPGIKNVIAVGSGKGGVGKSTTAVNLALALAQEGARVGVLDADVYGPSMPKMLGLDDQQPHSVDGKSMQPLEAYGLKVMSIGFLVEADTPMIWRGPMVMQALQQLLNDTRWDELDYLVVDLPPGTGDTQLTLAQKVPVTGAVVITTPQDVALIDARKGLKMFEKVDIQILGVIENMSIHICSNCGHAEHIFGHGGGEKMCADFGAELLGSLPLELAIREQADSGKPTVVSAPDSKAAEIYRQIARRIAVKIGERPRDMRDRFPNIVVENKPS